MADAKKICSSLRFLTLNQNILRVNNVYMPNSPWESDFVTVTPALYYTEYEIKTSRADFLADFRKKSCNSKHSIKRHDFLASKVKCTGKYVNKVRIPRPKKFYFVILEGECIDKDIPEHCGFVTFNPDKYTPRWPSAALTFERDAPVLEGFTKLSEKDIFRIAVKLGFRLG